MNNSVTMELLSKGGTPEAPSVDIWTVNDITPLNATGLEQAFNENFPDVDATYAKAVKKANATQKRSLLVRLLVEKKTIEETFAAVLKHDKIETPKPKGEVVPFVTAASEHMESVVEIMEPDMISQTAHELENLTPDKAEAMALELLAASWPP